MFFGIMVTIPSVRLSSVGAAVPSTCSYAPSAVSSKGTLRFPRMLVLRTLERMSLFSQAVLMMSSTIVGTGTTPDTFSVRRLLTSASFSLTR